MDLLKVRDAIDTIDQSILSLLVERIILAKDAGRIKKNQGLKIYDQKREEEILNRLSKNGGELGLDEEFIKKFILFDY